MARKQEAAAGWMVPVGTVLPFTGIDPDSLGAGGWLVCNGFEASQTEFSELYAVIGDAYGSSEGKFALPDLRGTFLRGRDAGAQRDPGVHLRTPQGNGTAKCDAIGSREGWATARPVKPFEAVAQHLPDDHHKGNYGSLIGKEFANWNGGSETVDVGEGGDKESRPRNRYVYWIIKARSVTADGKDVVLPLGAAVAFGSASSDELYPQWLPCNGNAYSNLGVYKSLYEVIKTAHGGQGNPMFNIPDYRGTFLRGVDSGAGVDPNAGTRPAPLPGGNNGDAVGSAQSFATALPTGEGRKITMKVPHLPTDDHKVDNIAGRSTARYTSDSSSVDASGGGGDVESRPINVYVDWYLRFRTAGTEPETPVGVIVAYGGGLQTPDDDFWIRCEGQPLDIADKKYAAIFAVLGFTHGGDKESGLFNLPDYRGRFLRGTDYGAGQDAEAGSRSAPAVGGDSGDRVGSVQGFATARPEAPFKASLRHLPDSSNDVAATAIGHDVAAHNGGSVTIKDGWDGGDPETRPVNVYADYYIKYALSTDAAS